VRIPEVSAMTPTETNWSGLLPALRALPRTDKLRVIQFLASELAQEEGAPLPEAGGAYPVWTPLHAFDAAAVMLKALQDEGNGS
jgi:hypothetical protein